jgi:hypothetical protein
MKVVKRQLCVAYADLSLYGEENEIKNEIKYGDDSIVGEALPKISEHIIIRTN